MGVLNRALLIDHRSVFWLQYYTQNESYSISRPGPDSANLGEFDKNND